eukprot:826315-Prymnesium_polylepis.1
MCDDAVRPDFVAKYRCTCLRTFFRISDIFETLQAGDRILPNMLSGRPKHESVFHDDRSWHL